MVVGDLATNVDVLVLGAGPAGYAAALRAAQLGQEVVLVDPEPPGGSLGRWTLPLKFLLDAVQQFHQLPSLAERGIIIDKPELDWLKMQVWKNRRVETALAEMKRQLEEQQVERIAGQGRFLAENEAWIEAEYGAKRYLFDHAVIATGGEPAPCPGLPFDGKRVLTPAQALALAELPPSLTILGAAEPAAELATLFAKLGVAMRLLLPNGQRLLPEFDPAAGQVVQVSLQALGVEIKNLSGLKNLTGLIVVSAGLTPATTNLGLDKARVMTDASGFISINERQQTSRPAIYAAGAVTGVPPLAHVAAKQGRVAAENIAGQVAQFAPQAIPRVAYIDPPVATVGLTAAQAEAVGYHVSHITHHAPRTTDQFIQLIAEQESEVLLGVTITGPGADILIGEAALALEMGATLTDLAETLHPLGGDTLARAAEAGLGPQMDTD